MVPYKYCTICTVRISTYSVTEGCPFTGRFGIFHLVDEIASPAPLGSFTSTAFPNPFPFKVHSLSRQLEAQLYNFWLEPIRNQYFTLNLFLDGEIRIKRIYEECFPGAWPYSHSLSFICSLVSSMNFNPILGPPVVPYYHTAPSLLELMVLAMKRSGGKGDVWGLEAEGWLLKNSL